MDNVTIPDEVWRAAMSIYHKTLRKNPGMAWQGSHRRRAQCVAGDAWGLVRRALGCSWFHPRPAEGEQR